jgi:hypothetical protein
MALAPSFLIRPVRRGHAGQDFAGLLIERPVMKPRLQVPHNMDDGERAILAHAVQGFSDLPGADALDVTAYSGHPISLHSAMKSMIIPQSVHVS